MSVTVVSVWSAALSPTGLGKVARQPEIVRCGFIRVVGKPLAARHYVDQLINSGCARTEICLGSLWLLTTIFEIRQFVSILLTAGRSAALRTHNSFLDRALDHSPTNFRLTAKNQVRSRVVAWLRIWDRQQSAFYLLGEAIKVAARAALQARPKKLARIKRII
jgi:hypothetical protein